MPTLTFILPDGTPRPLQFDEDDPSVMHAGVRANMPNLPADCGGQLACATRPASGSDSMRPLDLGSWGVGGSS